MTSRGEPCCTCFDSYYPPFRHNLCFGNLKGLDHLTCPRLNKGNSFTLEERMLLGIHGFLPPNVHTIEEQISACIESLDLFESPIAKYLYLLNLRNTNEILFFQLANENLSTIYPLIYTPTLFDASLKAHLFYSHTKGLYISINDTGYIRHMLLNWPEELVRGVVVSDCESVLGLGDIGCNGMAATFSKVLLYTMLGQVPPHLLVPIVLDVGTNNGELRQDPKYCGLKQRRVRGRRYYEFIHELMEALNTRWGPRTVIQFENFHAQNAIQIFAKYKMNHCIMNDNLQGIPIVIIAALISALKSNALKDKSDLKEHIILFMGAGQVAVGIAHFLVKFLIREGFLEREAIDRIWMYDSKGLVVKSRFDLKNTGKERFAKDYTPIYNFQDTLYEVCPTILIGASKMQGAFDKEILNAMNLYSPAPVIFTISCPVEKVECLNKDAIEYTEGHALFASTVPCEAYDYAGKEYSSSQIHSNYIFPGVMLACVAGRIRRITNQMLLECAFTVADLMTSEERENGLLLPSLSRIFDINLGVATIFLDLAYKNNLAEFLPEPENKAEFLYNFTYRAEYPRSLPPVWD